MSGDIWRSCGGSDWGSWIWEFAEHPRRSLRAWLSCLCCSQVYRSPEWRNSQWDPLSVSSCEVILEPSSSQDFGDLRHVSWTFFGVGVRFESVYHGDLLEPLERAGGFLVFVGFLVFEHS